VTRIDKRIVAIEGTALIDGAFVRDVVVVVRGGLIERVGLDGEISVPEGTDRIDSEGQLLAPGFVDIHIHGFGGCRAEDDATGMARQVIQHGTTWFLPTLISNELGEMLDAIRHICSCVGSISAGATIGGIHLEGPFLNPKYGAQQPEFNIEPNKLSVNQLVRACGDHLRLVTIAPERKGAIEAVKTFRAAGSIVAIGHSDATQEEYMEGRTAGITHATHIFNAMAMRRWPSEKTYTGCKAIGIEELILSDDEVSADIMCDSAAAHVHSSLLKIALKCKGAKRLALITDAVPAAGQPPGQYNLSDGQSNFTTSKDDVVRLANGSLCGSAMSMCGALRNVMKHANVPLETALVMASEAPSRAIGIFDRKGSISVGKDADLVWLDSDQNICRVMINGRTEFRSEEKSA